jgi:hypothetical protein
VIGEPAVPERERNAVWVYTPSRKTTLSPPFTLPSAAAGVVGAAFVVPGALGDPPGDT